ncbi:MAG TPA: lysophospholipid acyltransferase family protein [Myxococcota bacterium]|nr:lysophospholipid acyltransferase family protein [Myxococcota bacterium]
MRDQIRRLFQRWFRGHVRGQLARTFDGVFVAGLGETRRLLQNGPVLFAANHRCRWDAMLLIALDEALGGQGAVLMDADNLRQFSFFRALGAIPLDRRHAAATRRGLRRGQEHLKNPGASLWIFPQGRQRPAELRPLGLQRGVELLAKGVTTIPVSFYFQFRDTFQQCIIVRFGEPVEDPAALEAALIAGQLQAAEDVDAGRMQGYSLLVPPPPPQPIDLPTRMLSAFWDWFLPEGG